MPHKRMTKEEKHWQAEGDAHTLARAQEVQGDPTRMAAAKKIAATEAKELQKQTRATQNVAKRKTPMAKPAVKKKTGPPRTRPRPRGRKQ